MQLWNVFSQKAEQYNEYNVFGSSFMIAKS